jgi:DNA mismatch repair protein MSH3
MGTPRSSAVPSSQQSADKKQKSISSFFTAKPAAPVKPKSVQQVQRREPSPPKAVDEDYGNDLFVSEDEAATNDRQESPQGPKRSLDETTDVNGDIGLPDLKRLRYGVEETVKDAGPGDGDVGKQSLVPQKSSLSAARKPKTTERTSKYLFSSSPAVVPQEQDGG